MDQNAEWEVSKAIRRTFNSSIVEMTKCIEKMAAVNTSEFLPEAKDKHADYLIHMTEMMIKVKNVSEE